MKRLRENALAAILLGVLTAPTLTISAFGQQEVDPTWYDPWAKPTAVSAPQTKAAIGTHKKAVVASSALPKAKKKSGVVNTGRETSRTQVALATK